MYFDKLVSLLSAFSKDDIRQLESYIHSPYFNVASASVALFNYLVPLYPDFPEKRLEPDYIAARMKALPTQATQRTAGTRLLKAIEHFIALEDWQSSEMNVAWHQFHALRQLQRLNEFAGEFQKMIGKIEDDPEQDFNTFYDRHRFIELANSSFDAKLNRTIRNEISPAIKTLNEFHAIKLLRYMCEAVSRKQVLGAGFDETYIASALKILEPYNQQKYPYVYLFVNVYRMLSADSYSASEPYYRLIKQFIAVREGNTLPQSCIESMSYAINWCLYWNAKGYEATSSEYMWWIDLKIKYNLLLEDRKLLPITFRNSIVLSISSNHSPKWMQDFIRQYSSCLPAEHKETNVAFAKGLYYYRIKDFTKAIQSFKTAQAKEEVIFNALIKRWEYICTYELNPADTEFLYSQLRSYDRYIERNETSLHQLKTGFSLFIDYAKTLIKLANRKERLEMKSSLEKEVFFPGKHWLLQKLE